MSNIPYTSLVVNQRGVDVFSTTDYVYLLAPALSGGEKRDADNKPIIVDGHDIFEPKLFTNLTDFEQEFGLASNGSPASMYAKWIFDRGEFNIYCRRVVSDSLSFSSATLKSEEGLGIVKLTSLATAYDANNIMVDISSNSSREAYLYSPNAILNINSGIVTTVLEYTSDNYIVFEGKHFNTNMLFRIGFYGEGSKSYQILDFNIANIACNDRIYHNAGNSIAGNQIKSDQYSYDILSKELRFGFPPPVGMFNIVADVKNIDGKIFKAWFSADGISSIYRTNFIGDNIDFRAFYVDGIGFDWDQKNIREARFFTTERFTTNNVFVGCSNGTLPDTAKLLVVDKDNNGNIVKEELYDNLQSLDDLYARVKDRPNYLNPSQLINIELLTTNIKTKLVQRLETTQLVNYGVNVSIYKSGGYETYDNVRDADQMTVLINANSRLLSAEVLMLRGNARLESSVLGLRLSGADPGLAVTTVNYVDGLLEASYIDNITIVIAPGVSDTAFHALLKDHCIENTNVGKYRTCIIGGEAGESIEAKQQRSIYLSHELVCCIGDGLYLVDPRDAERKLFAPSVAVAPFVGQLLSERVFTCQTHKYISNAYGIEHNYDDAQLQSIRDAGGRLVLFRYDSGVQIIDAITTSTYNTYEDLHMVRLYNVISRNIRKELMRSVVGRNNMPPTWGYVTNLIRRIMEIVKDYGAIESYSFLTDVNPADLVDRRYKFKLGIIPTFPVKYVEANIDILPALL